MTQPQPCAAPSAKLTVPEMRENVFRHWSDWGYADFCERLALRLDTPESVEAWQNFNKLAGALAQFDDRVLSILCGGER